MSAPGDDPPDIPLDPDRDVGPIFDLDTRLRLRRGVTAQRVIVAALGIGGALGAIARYAISLGVPTVDGRFPWGTFIINVSGSLVLGFLLILILEQFPRGRLVRPVIGTGFIGAYTTFSTFTVEAAELIRDKHPMIAVIYLLASLGTGLLAVWLGITGARVAVRAERWLQEEMR